MNCDKRRDLTNSHDSLSYEVWLQVGDLAAFSRLGYLEQSPSFYDSILLYLVQSRLLM